MDKTMCELCLNKGWIWTINTNTNTQEVQKCDDCNVFESDQEAQLHSSHANEINLLYKENNMDNKLDFDEVCDLASKLYWEVVNKFDAENKCVMSDPDNKGGTRNTEFGQELYYLIEDTIKESIDYKEEDE